MQTSRALCRFMFVFFVCIGLTAPLFGQTFKIKGIVRDSLSAAAMPGTLVGVVGSKIGSSTDKKGTFEIKLAKGNYTLSFTILGYEKKLVKIELDKDITIDVPLKQDPTLLNQIIVTDQKGDGNITDSDLASHKLNIREIERIPVLLGETDLIKSIQLLPGVQSAGEGNSGFFVRGGGIDQNLILFDNVPIYNISHLFGFLSIFNPFAVENVNLIKAGMPANYGGRVASILDIEAKKGSMQALHGGGSIGILTTNLFVEAPIVKNKCSILITGRRTYIDLFMNLFFRDTRYASNYYFYDLNAKLTWVLSPKDVLTVNGATVSDFFKYDDVKSNKFSNGIVWGTNLVSTTWMHKFSPQLSSTMTAYMSDYKLNFNAGVFDYTIKLNSQIKDLGWKYDFKYMLGARNIIHVGTEYIHHVFLPNNITAQSNSSELQIARKSVIYAQEASLYACDEYTLSDKIVVNGGLRVSAFQHLGPFDRLVVDQNYLVIDTIHSNPWKPIKTYVHPEPRISARYLINKASSIKAGYSQNYQYVHLAPVSSMSLPTDVWVPSSENIKPQFGEQYSIGYYRNFKKNMFESSVDVFYKQMKNLIEYKEGIVSVASVTSNFDEQFFFGKGKSYGVEFFLKKTSGRATGWISYTLSKSTRRFSDIENGREFYAKYDRRHDLSVIAMYELNKRWSISAVFVFATGNTMTLPVERYMIQGSIINVYSPKNSYRMPAYHRLDVSATYIIKKTEKRESSLNFSVYNAYNRANPYYIYFETQGDLSTYSMSIKAQQVSLFPILPSVSWKILF